MAPQDRVKVLAAQVTAAAPKTRGTVAMVGAPLCEGQNLGGVDLAPAALRTSGIEKVVNSLDWGFQDFGDTPRPTAEDAKAYKRPAGEYYPTEKVTNSAAAGAGVGSVYERVVAAAGDNRFALTVGGDHSIASGSILALHRHRPDLGVVWIDAHADCNTPATSPSRHYHGMPLAHALGWFDKRAEGFEWCHDHLDKYGALPEDRVALIALRDVDPEEKELLKKSNVHVFTMFDVDQHGIGKVMDLAIEAIDPKGRRPLHLSFDIDSIDPAVAPGTGTKARGGLSYREAHFICERLAATERLNSMDIVEVNPALDANSEEVMHGDNPDIRGTETVRLGIELVTSALSKTIL